MNNRFVVGDAEYSVQPSPFADRKYDIRRSSKLGPLYASKLQYDHPSIYAAALSWADGPFYETMDVADFLHRIFGAVIRV